TKCQSALTFVRLPPSPRTARSALGLDVLPPLVSPQPGGRWRRRGTISLSGNRRAREKHQGLERPNGMQLECHHACDAERQLLQQIVSFFDRLAVHNEYDAQS